MAEFDADVLLPNDRLKELVAAGDLVQLHRGHAYCEEGDTFVLDGRRYEVTEVTRERLGDITEEDARKEGADSLDDYKRRLQRAHEDFEWDDDSEAVKHVFEPVE